MKLQSSNKWSKYNNKKSRFNSLQVADVEFAQIQSKVVECLARGNESLKQMSRVSVAANTWHRT
jgi:hypothetical protein